MVAAESVVRVYLPATVPMLAELARSGVLGAAALSGHAVTAAVREWYTDGDEEELEYVAFVRAAQQALDLLRAEPSAPRLRAVVSADVPARLLATVGGDLGDSQVRIAEPVRLGCVAALHCDSADAVTLVGAAVAAATDGDGEEPPAVEAVEDEALEWYDVTELEQLVADRSGGR